MYQRVTLCRVQGKHSAHTLTTTDYKEVQMLVQCWPNVGSMFAQCLPNVGPMLVILERGFTVRTYQDPKDIPRKTQKNQKPMTISNRPSLSFSLKSVHKKEKPFQWLSETFKKWEVRFELLLKLHKYYIHYHVTECLWFLCFCTSQW